MPVLSYPGTRTTGPCLVVHLAAGGERFVEATETGRAASPLDCLADLLEIGLTAEARDFARALNHRAKSKSTEA